MEVPRDVHSLSLKVLRLTRPSFSQQIPLSTNSMSSSHNLDTASASDTRDASFDKQFILSPVLTLPPAFGAAYVGETFSCALCANNELAAGSERSVSNVKIWGEMQAPSGNFPLDLSPDDENAAHFEIAPGQSLQRIVHFDLREEGSHTLAVNVSYSETTATKGQSASSGRFRSFRKLYQFGARPCLNVRTKISPLEVEDQPEFRSLALEAQLDNVSDESVVLKNVGFTSKPAFRSTSLNWDAAPKTEETSKCPILSPRDVMQVAFLIEQLDEGPKRELTRDGRVILGQLNIHWRTSMGDAGYLSTGWLTTKRSIGIKRPLSERENFDFPAQALYVNPTDPRRLANFPRDIASVLAHAPAIAASHADETQLVSYRMNRSAKRLYGSDLRLKGPDNQIDLERGILHQSIRGQHP